MSDQLLVQFDANGNLLSEPVERTEAHRKGIWHRAVSIFILNGRGEFLVEKRSSTKDLFPNFYDVPGGHVEPSQSPKIAALSELSEELGLIIDDSDLQRLSGDDEVIEQVIIPDQSIINLERKTIFWASIDDGQEADILRRAAEWARLDSTELAERGVYGEVSHVEMWSWEKILAAVENPDRRIVASGTESALACPAVRKQISDIALTRRHEVRSRFFSAYVPLLGEHTDCSSRDGQLAGFFRGYPSAPAAPSLVKRVFTNGTEQLSGAYKVGSFRLAMAGDPHWIQKLNDPQGRYVDNLIRAVVHESVAPDEISNLASSVRSFVRELLNLPMLSGERFRDSLGNLTEIAVAQRAAIAFLDHQARHLIATGCVSRSAQASIDSYLSAGKYLRSLWHPAPGERASEQFRSLLLIGLGAAAADINNPEFQERLKAENGLGPWLNQFFLDRIPEDLSADLGGDQFLQEFFENYVERRWEGSIVYLAGSAAQSYITLTLCEMLLKLNPCLKISLMPKGADTGNDLTFSQVEKVLSAEANTAFHDLERYRSEGRFFVIENGPLGPGLDPASLSNDAVRAISNADLVLAEGQAYAEIRGWKILTYIVFRVNGRVAEAIHGVQRGACGFVRLTQGIPHFSGFESAMNRFRRDVVSNALIPTAEQTTTEYIRAILSTNFRLVVSHLFCGDRVRAIQAIKKEAQRLGRTFACIVLGVTGDRAFVHDDSDPSDQSRHVFALGGGGGFSGVTLRALRMLGVPYVAGVPSTDDGGSTGELQAWLRKRRGFVFGVGDLAAIFQDAMRNRGQQAILSYRFAEEPTDLPIAVLQRIVEEAERPHYAESSLAAASYYLSFVFDQLNLAHVIERSFRSEDDPQRLPVKGASIRNLNVIAALELCGCLGSQSPDSLSRKNHALYVLRCALGIQNDIVALPVTYDECALYVDYELPVSSSEQSVYSIPEEALKQQRKRLIGQRLIDHFSHNGGRLNVGVVRNIFETECRPQTNSTYLEYLQRAQLVVMGAGSLIGSQLAQITMPGIVDALLKIKVRSVLIINHVRMDETLGMSLSDQIRIIEAVANSAVSRNAKWEATQGERDLVISDIFTDIVVPRSVAKELEQAISRLDLTITPAEKWIVLEEEWLGKPLRLFRNRYIEYLLENRSVWNSLGITRRELEILSYLEQPRDLYDGRSEAGRYRGAVFATDEDIEYILAQGIKRRNIHEVDAIGENWKIRKTIGQPVFEFFPGLVPEALVGIFRIALERGVAVVPPKPTTDTSNAPE